MFARIPKRSRRPSLGIAMGVVVLVLAAPGGAGAAPGGTAELTKSTPTVSR